MQLGYDNRSWIFFKILLVASFFKKSWLPIKYRIEFKNCLLVFKTLNTGLLGYFKPWLAPYTCAVNTGRNDPAIYSSKMLNIIEKYINQNFILIPVLRYMALSCGILCQVILECLMMFLRLGSALRPINSILSNTEIAVYLLVMFLCYRPIKLSWIVKLIYYGASEYASGINGCTL